MPAAPVSQIQAETRGTVPAGAVEFALHHVSSLLRKAPGPVLFGRVKLTMAADPAVERPAIAQASVDVNGRIIRARAAGVTMREAVQRACDRLGVRLAKAAPRQRAKRGSRRAAEPGEWPNPNRPTSRPPPHTPPPGERAMMRRKSYTPAAETPGQAAAEADLLGYDFHLFTEQSTGEDAVIYRSGAGYRLALAHPHPGRLGPVGPAIDVIPAPAPRLTVAEAASRLEAASEPFLFFRDAKTGRGNVIYLRYDGHFGLIAPPAGHRHQRLSRDG
jgi:sigma 54 modulation/S30EA-like ribosomal protein